MEIIKIRSSFIDKSTLKKFGNKNNAKINFEDNTFDRVFCISTIEHFEKEFIKKS